MEKKLSISSLISQKNKSNNLVIMSDFKKTAFNPYDSLQAQAMASQARTERYVDFDQMEYTPVIASAFSTYL